MPILQKGQLIEQLAIRFPDLGALDVQEAVGLILKQIMDEVEQGGRVEVRGFGAFSLKALNAREARNPKTGVPVLISAKHRFRFKVSRLLLAILNESKDENHA